MKISLKNIGKVKEANIEINGITVIAGENNTGKSTVGKTLFSVFNSFYNIEETIKKERQKLIGSRITQYLISKDFSIVSSNRIMDFIGDMARELLDKNPQTNNELKEILITKFQKEIISFNDRFFNFKENEVSENIEFTNLVKMIFDILNLENSYIFKIYFQKNLVDEFNGQINNLYNNDTGEIELSISNKKITTIIKSQKIENIIGIEEKILSLYTRAIYIDDPFILDNNLHTREIFAHKDYLKSILNSFKKEKNLVEDALIEKKLEKITNKLKNIFDGEILFTSDGSRNKFKLKDSKEELDIRNLSTGLKTFAILKTLLNNGILEKNGTIILDEPEIHLHPEWQLVFAEIIVLLQKELELHILLTTHSPYFLRAIQVYSANHGIADKCKYYLAENEENSSIIKDVSQKIDLIFKKLSHPLQILEDLMYE